MFTDRTQIEKLTSFANELEALQQKLGRHKRRLSSVFANLKQRVGGYFRMVCVENNNFSAVMRHQTTRTAGHLPGGVVIV
jgi:hypothetical protein